MIEINLLPKELQIQGPRFSFGKGMLIPAAAAVVLLAGMAAMSVYQRNQLRDLDSKIRIAKARAEQLQRDIQMVDGLVDIKGKITARIDAVKVLDLNRSAWVNMLEDLSGRIPEFLWLTAMREAAPPPQASRAPGDTAGKAAAPIGQQVAAEIEGYAYSLSSLANLIISMRKSGHFKQVDLIHAREVALETHPAYSFAVSCMLDYTGTRATDGPDVGVHDQLAAKAQSTDKRN